MKKTGDFQLPGRPEERTWLRERLALDAGQQLMPKAVTKYAQQGLTMGGS